MGSVSIFCHSFEIPYRMLLKGNSHQILLSEMSLPGIEVLIEKLLTIILRRLGNENPSKRQCKVAVVQRKCAVTSSVSVRFLYAMSNLSRKKSVCMQGSREYCPVWCRIPELFVRVPTAVRYATKCYVTSHDTSSGLLGTSQASNIGKWHTKKRFWSSFYHNY